MGFSGSVRDKFDKVVWWFRDQPLIIKAAIVGLTLLVLLILLGPFLPLIPALVLGASLLVFIIRRPQGRSARGWTVVAGFSLVLTFIFSGVVAVIYGAGTSTIVGPWVGGVPTYEVVDSELDEFTEIMTVRVEADPNSEDQIFKICDAVRDEYPEGAGFEMGLFSDSGNRLGVYYLADNAEVENFYYFLRTQNPNIDYFPVPCVELPPGQKFIHPMSIE